jgi:phosphoglycerol transferase MdoB-like AlkP superfamily enzyme
MTAVYAFLFPLVIAPTLWRAHSVSETVYSATGEDSTAFVEVLRNDAPLVGALLFFLTLAATVRNRRLALTLFLGAAAIKLALISDIIIDHQFSQRLVWLDIVKFFPYAFNYIFSLNATVLFYMAAGMLVLFLLGCKIFNAIHRAELSLKNASYLISLIILASIFGWQGRNIEYVHYRLYQNFISYNNMLSSEAVAYSAPYAATMTNPSKNICATNPTLSGPIIIYMVESLSSYHSKMFGGVNDWTPRLDEIAMHNAALTNFYANGFTTEDGLLSLLTAQSPLYPPNSFSKGGGSAFKGHWTPDRSLARIFNRNGYESIFITTSDLSFSSTGDWASALGFQTVRGSTDPFYNGMKRFHFGAAADAALVENILRLVDTAQSTPFIFAKTVTSHHPHTHPTTGERSVEAVMRYVDSQIGDLYDGLKARDFFTSGHLVIVGDHRAMLAVTRAEVEKFGLEKAYTQVPAVVIGRQLVPIARNITAPYSQADLSNTLMGLFSGETCYNPFQGVIWGEVVRPPNYILHRRGDRRNQISVFSQDRLGVITLNGDNTSFEGRRFTSEEKDSIVRYVNVARINAVLAEQDRLIDSEIVDFH